MGNLVRRELEGRVIAFTIDDFRFTIRNTLDNVS